MIEWLLDLDRLGFGDEGVSFGLARPLAPWAWLLIFIAAFGLAVWSYRRLEGARLWRIGLAGSRALLLLLLTLLIAGPRLIKPNETEERDWVVVLVDRSASLSIPDAKRADGERQSREEQLRAIIGSNHELWTDLSREREVVWLGFDSSTHELSTSDAGTFTVDLGKPDGRRTSIGRALQQAMRRAAARPLSGVVLLSDGRSSDMPPPSVVQALKAEQVPIYTVALGSEGEAIDAAVRAVDAPRVAFTDDIVPVTVNLERLGSEGGARTVRLIDSQTGLVLDEQEIDWSEPTRDSEDGPERSTADVTLTSRPKDAGSAEWSVSIGEPGGDLIASNDASAFSLELVDRPMRVVYFDGYPRWEQRFIKHLLEREESIESSVLMLSPNRRYLQEGDVVMDVLPSSPEDWAVFDVVVMGDLRSQMFTEEQLAQLRDHVGIRGGGLVWIGGEGATPSSWRGTPLEDLLPFALSGSETVHAWSNDVTMRATPAADRLGVLRLAPEPIDGSWWPERLSDPETGWSRLKYAQRIELDTLKPTSEVLAISEPVFGTDPPTPLIMSMRYGAGRVLYIATDEVWRWRYGRGEYFPERFWLQMIRLLGRERLSRSGKSAVLEISPDRTQVDQPVRIGVDLIDQLLLDAPPGAIRVRVTRIGDVGGESTGGPDEGDAGSELELRPEAGDGSAASGSYAATWLPVESGRFRVEVIDPLAGIAGLTGEIEVWQPDDEFRRPGADHVLLAGLAEETGGQAMTAADLSSLPDLLPNRRVRLIGIPDIDDLWDTPLALLLVIFLLTFEWVGRRVLRLA